MALNCKRTWGGACGTSKLYTGGRGPSALGTKAGHLEDTDTQKRVVMGHAVLARLVWDCCGRRPGIEAWMEGACPQDNMGAEHTVSKLGSEC